MELLKETCGMNQLGNGGGRGGSCVPPVLAGEAAGKRRAWMAAWLLAVGLGLAVVHGYAPDTHGFYPRCEMFAWSGLHCPGCGSLRAIHHLTHGRWLAALGANAMLVAGLAGGMVWGIARWWRGRAFEWESSLGRPGVVWLAVIALLSFTVLRNLPWVPFLWLAP